MVKGAASQQRRRVRVEMDNPRCPLVALQGADAFSLLDINDLDGVIATACKVKAQGSGAWQAAAAILLSWLH